MRITLVTPLISWEKIENLQDMKAFRPLKYLILVRFSKFNFRQKFRIILIGQGFRRNTYLKAQNRKN